MAEHSYLPSCKSASEFPLYLWVVLDLQDLVLNLLGVVYVVTISMTLPAYWHCGYNSQYAVPANQRGLSPYKMLFRGAVAPIAPMVPPPMGELMSSLAVQCYAMLATRLNIQPILLGS